MKPIPANRALELLIDRPDLDMRKGDSVMFHDERPGLDGPGLYAIRGGRSGQEYYWMVDRLDPTTLRGTPRKLFFCDGFRFDRENIGDCIQVYRVIATYRQEPGIGRWED